MKISTQRITAFMITLAMLCVICVPGPSQVRAENDTTQIRSEIEKLEEEKAKIDEQISGLKAQFDTNMSEIERLAEERAVIDQQITLLYDKMDNINDQIHIYSTMISEKQVLLEKAQERLEVLTQQHKERIRAMEENGKLSYWEVIFQAKSFSDFLDRLNMIEEIDRADQQRLEEIRLAAEEVENTKTELENKKADLEEARSELLQTEQEVKTKKAETDALLQQLLSKGAEYEKYIAQQEEKAAELAGQIDEKEGLLNEKEKEEYDQWLGNQKPSDEGNTVDGVTWLVPINYTYVASPYGMRDHPIDGIYKMHNGVDLDAPMYTPIYASRSGVVYYRGWWGTGGNTIMINHQDGYISRYLHMDSFAVKNGEWVAAGQIIGYCGDTGGSTGPHLHFEIQYNGSYVNPAEYINIS